MNKLNSNQYMLLIVVVLMFQILVACNSNNIENNDWERLGLTSGVKRISEQTFENTKKFGDNTISDLPQIAYNLNFPCDKRVFMFNKKGQVISGIIDFGIDKLNQICTYRKGKLIQEDFLLDDREFYSIDHITNTNTNWVSFRSIIDRNILWPIKHGAYINWGDQLDKLFKTKFQDTIVIVRKIELSNYVFRKKEIYDIFYFNTEKELIGHGIPGSIWTFKNDAGKCEYYNDGKLKLKRYFKTIERYDYMNGLLTKITVYNYNNNVEAFVEYEYDDHKRVVKEIHKDKSTTGYGYNIVWEVSYLYNEDEELTKIVKKRPQYRNDSTSFEYENHQLKFIKNDKYKYELIYDDCNKLMSAKGSIIDKYENIGPYEFNYEYIPVEYLSIKYVKVFDESKYSKVETKYDSKGNWVSKLCYIKDEPAIWKIREIEYY